MYRTVINFFTVILLLNLVVGNGAILWLGFNLRNHVMPPGAVSVGRDLNGDEMFVARIKHKGEVLPGKAIPAKNFCFASTNGKEIMSEDCEVLIQDMFGWDEGSNGRVPSGAVEVGKTRDGESLYYGRKESNGYIIPGRVHKGLGAFYYPFNGNEYHSSTYQVLISRNNAHFEVHDYNHFY